MISRQHWKPFSILFVSMVSACLYFWLTSRYPDLGAKAALGGTAPLSGLGFVPLFEIKPEFSLWEKLFYGTLNWMETNRRGMTFAFILGAFFLSMLPLVQVKRLKTALGNAMLGVLMGTPLGLCVNCSSPVARAMQASGMRLEAAIALLVSSPTMNVVVLSMAFAFFPLYLVLGKIALTLLLVLVVVPLACRYWFQKESMVNAAQAQDCDETQKCTLPEIKGWMGAIWWVIKTYVRNFIRIVIITGPLMILAGFVGTVIITLLPWALVRELEQTIGDPMAVGGIMLLIAVIGAVLPSPMAFDVAMSAFLLQTGVPAPYVAVFLFTLGAYSVYAFFIVWQAISLRVAVFLYVMTCAFGLVLGGATFIFEAHYLEKAQADLESVAELEDLDPIIPRQDTAFPYSDLQQELEKTKSVFHPVSGLDLPKGLRVERRDFIKGAQDAKTPFTRIYGDDLGILQPYRISYLTGIDDLPRLTSSIASGDVHNDGWEDILILGDHEVSPNVILYANMGGAGFKRQEIPAAQDAVLVALADLDGDGWLDIIYSTYEGKNFVVYNQKGAFLEENKKPLGDDLAGTTNSMGFADVDRDGDLEIFLGNWSVGPVFIDHPDSRDMILTRQGEGYSSKELLGLTGETLTSMFWDFNQDGHLDIFIGNDFIGYYISDLILLGDGKGGFSLPPPEFVSKFRGAQSTMSMDAADINRDSKPDFYIGQIAYIGHYLRKMSKISARQIAPHEFCAREGLSGEALKVCEEEMEFKHALAKVTNFISDGCASLQNQTYKKMCEIHLLNNCFDKNRSVLLTGSPLDAQSRYGLFCSRIKDAKKAQQMTMKDLFPKDMRPYHLEAGNESSSNILLQDVEGKGAYTDIAKERGVGYGGWTWNAKFADLDHDGWEDLYITNGFSMPLSLGTKVFYRNKGDGAFEDVTVSSGLEDFSNTASYTYVDYDHDGDLDIIAVPLDGPVKLFRNEMGSTKNSLQIELRDATSKNPFGIGAKIVIGDQQWRVIKGSGGYKSFDAPIAHFGLGEQKVVNQISITWPDGKTDVLSGEFTAGARYRISRGP